MLFFYSGLAFVAILSALAVRKMGMGNFIEKKQFHDLGKLLFAFCVVGADFLRPVPGHLVRESPR